MAANRRLRLVSAASVGAILWRLRVPAFSAAILAILIYLPGRTDIAPRVSSDYCYQLLAADRLYDGLGLTSLQPVAPLQPWEWRYDWGFLTQWPAGYALIVWACRRVTGLAMLPVCRGLCMAACTFALVGWFCLVRRVSPGGIGGLLLALVAAGCSVTVGSMINPSTDTFVTAMVPWVLWLVTTAETRDSCAHEESSVSMRDELPHGQFPLRTARRTNTILFLTGLAAGTLCWFRYAAIFLTIGIAIFLVTDCVLRRDRRGKGLLAFLLGAAIPVVSLFLVNRIMGVGSTQTQLNLGHTIGFHFELALVSTAWFRFTSLGFYNYLPVSNWVFALWPVVMALAFFLNRYLRQGCKSREVPVLVSRTWRLSACVVAGLFVLLIGSTSVFGDKFDYVGLDRYYLPVKPLYFVLFVSPVLWWLRSRRAHDRFAMRLLSRIGRVAACSFLLLATSWLLRYEWTRTYHRWLAADHERTPSGWMARCFTPGAANLYRWLNTKSSADTVIVSNFHEYLAFETGMPTIPIPDDCGTLNVWVGRIASARGIRDPQVLFILDRDNRWRDYWQPARSRVIEQFQLTPCLGRDDSVATYVFRYEGFVGSGGEKSCRSSVGLTHSNS